MASWTATQAVAQSLALDSAEPVRPDALVLLFVPDAFVDGNHFLSDQAAVMAAVRSAEPWASLGPRLVARSVGPLPVADAACHLEREHRLEPGLVCDRSLADRLNALGLPAGWKLVVLSREPFPPRATLAAPGKSSPIFLSTTWDLGATSFRHAVLHELGHAFGLRDECDLLRLPAASPARGAGPPNCAPDRATAEQWWGDLVPPAGYIPGCGGLETAIRPTRSSFMSCGRPADGEPDGYGPVSLRYLRQALGLHPP
ncbi:MAG: hypothetical protein AMXMBFR64_05620 [Myxococcales bacterium]